jgi:hypothetical protein
MISLLLSSVLFWRLHTDPLSPSYLPVCKYPLYLLYFHLLPVCKFPSSSTPLYLCYLYFHYCILPHIYSYNVSHQVLLQP